MVTLPSIAVEAVEEVAPSSEAVAPGSVKPVKPPEERRGWNPNRWWVRQKLCQGFRGWRMKRGKCVKLGKLMWDFKSTGFPTKQAALKFIRTMGCDCCARPPPPARIHEGRYYRSGYSDFIMLLRG